ncbi:MAG TPA: DUF6457 domain-containing protein [Mycobacteriales bacterium]
MEDWTAAVAAELGLDAGPLAAAVRDRDLVLDLARDVAHGVARPAAPLTAYLLGLAVGSAGDPAVAAELADRVSALAQEWAPARPASEGTAGDGAGTGSGTA